ncbi:MAG: hypothetical protein AAGL89_14925 [Pseudomonadota bacterium]
MSKEHFWPRWMHELMPDPKTASFTEQRIQIENNRESEPRKTRTRQGGTKNKTLRVVCKDCNSGWMSELENEAKPILTPLILGDPIFLDDYHQSVLAKWITMKFMVVEHSYDNDHITLKSDRSIFFQSQTIPDYIRIRVAAHSDAFWSRAFQRHSATISTTPIAPFNPTGRNTQTIAFGSGKLFVFVYGCRNKNPDELLNFIRADRIPKIHPFERTLDWPIGDLAPKELDHAAQSLETLTKNARWLPL